MRRHSSLSAEKRRELQSAELQRFLLPGAPPRKRHARLPSPERDICPMVENKLPQPEPNPEPESQPEQEIEFYDFENMEFFILEQEVEILPSPSDPSASQSKSPNKSSLNASTDDDWEMKSDSDSDIDLDEHISPPVMTSDVTELESQVLQTADDLDDRVLRDIVPDDDLCHFEWKKHRTIFTGKRETFTGTPGPTFDVKKKTPVDIFYKMFDSDFIDRICTETNRYAEQKIASLKAAKKLLPSSRLHRWTPTDRDEMITFLAVFILQGLYPLPEEEKYFSFNGYGTMPYFARIISYNRFCLLKSLYHFVDSQTLTSDMSKLCKIQPVLDHLNEKFSTLYMPAQEIVIDESLLKWHGRLSFAQKIATKAAQVGVKTYELCESRSGYLWKFFVYTGKKTQTAPNNDQTPLTDESHDPVQASDQSNGTTDRPEEETDRLDDSLARPTNATSKIVIELVKPLLGRGHTLVMDNFYNSPLLLRYLKKQKTDCYGTLRLNRQFVPKPLKTLTKADLRQSEAAVTYCSDLSVMVWRDSNNLVSMISTYHRLEVGAQNKFNRLTYKPKIVLDYNKTMGGVDRKDQFLSAQPVERLRNKVWYKKVFRRLLSTAVFNAFVIFSSKNPKISHREFRTNLAEDLLKRHRRIDLTSEPRLQLNNAGKLTVKKTARTKVDHDHFPARSDVKKARCVMCTTRKKDARTIWKCIQCNVSLCIEHCFREYHKTVDLDVFEKLSKPL